MPPHIHVDPIEWIPNEPNESLAEYSRRLLPQIDATRPFFIIGFSFGAALAVEIAKHTKPLLVVVVSGIASNAEIPFYLKHARAFGAYHLAPYIVKIWTPLLRWGVGFSFGTRDPVALDVLVRMVQEMDPPFYQWGLEAFMDWDNTHVPPNLLHIHGSRDRLLPARYVEPDVVIKGGGHFIVYTHAAIVSELIGAELRTV